MRLPPRVLAALLALPAFVLPACGDDDDTTTDDTTTTVSSTEAPDGEAAVDFELYFRPEGGDDCAAVFPVPRAATVEGEVGDALTQLLAGPNEDEAAEGLTSWFSSDTEGMLNGVTVDAGLATVDFQDFSPIIPNASTSCGSAGLLAELDNTVLQFSEVDRVIYSFDGDAAAFYAWLQRDVPAA